MNIIEFFKTKFGKKQQNIYKELPLLKNGYLKVGIQYCELVNDVPTFLNKSIYSNDISVFSLENVPENKSFRIYSLDDLRNSFIQLNFENKILSDVLYMKRKFSYTLSKESYKEFYKEISGSKIELVNPHTGEKEIFIRDINNDDYNEETGEGFTYINLPSISEKFINETNEENKIKESCYMLFYKQTNSEFDTIVDPLLYIESVSKLKVDFYKTFLIDSSSVTFN